jgi:hypothetical protein
MPRQLGPSPLVGPLATNDAGGVADVQGGDGEMKLITAIVKPERLDDDAIAKSVNTGTVGDGKIWVSPLESALRVRTGERDRDSV